MKTSCIALAVLASCAGAASAQSSPAGSSQSSVTIYGIVDAGVVREWGGARGGITRLGSGAQSWSRIGFRGTEDLGGGLSALFVLEAGYRVDTGEQDVPNAAFQRQAFAGLKHAQFGALTFGRQYTPYYLTLATVADPFAAGLAGSAKNLMPTAGTRTSNTVYYTSPTIQGMTAEVSYAFGEQQGDSSAGRQFGASLGYTGGPLNVRLGFHHRNNDISPGAAAAATPPVAPLDRDIGRNVLLAANYDFGVMKAYLGYSYNEGTNSAPLPNTTNPFGRATPPLASTDSRDIIVGFTAPVGTGTLIASHIRKDDRGPLEQDARQWAIGYLYPLSKRTNLYAAIADIDNKRGASYTVGNNTDVGTGDKAYNLGVRHTF